MKNSILQMVIQGTALYLMYTCYTIYKKDQKVAKAQQIRMQQARYGGDFQLSEDKKKILEEADQYMRDHAGAKYLNRHRTKEFLETKIKDLIDEKKEHYKEMKEKNENDEELQNLLKEIEQLNEAYSHVKPKYTKLDDMVEHEEQQDDYFKKQQQ